MAHQIDPIFFLYDAYGPKKKNLGTKGISCEMLTKKIGIVYVAVHLGVKMADTLSFTAKVDMVDF